MISIVTPVLNGAKFIEKNIKSIQELRIAYEHIIVDGGSTDGTLDIIGKYPQITLIHQTEKNGMYGAIDLGFKHSKGDYIGWVNCDDIILADYFGQMYVLAEKHNWDFVNSDSMLFYMYENRTEKVRGTRFAKFFLKRGILPFVQPSSLYKKGLYDRVNGLNTNMKIASDIDLFNRMSRCKNTVFGYFPRTTTNFIKYGYSLGDLNSETACKERVLFNIPNPSMVIRFLYKLSKTI